ncbi:MAG: DUF1554 domain-containing protein [Patescibacteria group bacterium]
MNQVSIHHNRGFTLIELLIAIAMIGILVMAMVTILNPSEQLKKGRDAQRKQDLRQLQIALESFNADNNKYPDLYNLFGGADPWGQAWLPYMAKIPKDPISPKQDYYYQLPYVANGRWYTLYAKLEHCPDPQMIPGASCTYYNYAVASPNIAVAPLPTPTPTPTPTPLPTKRVFVTSSGGDGNLAGLVGADGLCNSLANAPGGIGGTWKAWLSTSGASGEDAKNRVPNAQYVRIDSVLVATSKTDLIDGTIANGIRRNEKNENVGTVSVWTGTKADGTVGGATCSNWTSTAGTGGVGSTVATIGAWTDDAAGNCVDNRRLYCFEQ